MSPTATIHGTDDPFVKMAEEVEERSIHAIRVRAYQIWQAAGEPSGRDLDFWLAAEADIERTYRRGLAGAAIEIDVYYERSLDTAREFANDMNLCPDSD